MLPSLVWSSLLMNWRPSLQRPISGKTNGVHYLTRQWRDHWSIQIKLRNFPWLQEEPLPSLGLSFSQNLPTKYRWQTFYLLNPSLSGQWMLFLPSLQSVLPDTTISLRNISCCYCITDYSTLPLFLLLQQSSRLTTALAVWGGVGELFQKGKFRDSAFSPPNAWAWWLSQGSVKTQAAQKGLKTMWRDKMVFISAQSITVSQVLWYTAPQCPETMGNYVFPKSSIDWEDPRVRITKSFKEFLILTT